MATVKWRSEEGEGREKFLRSKWRILGCDNVPDLASKTLDIIIDTYTPACVQYNSFGNTGKFNQSAYMWCVQIGARKRRGHRDGREMPEEHMENTRL
jgi:hypothetical protein